MYIDHRKFRFGLVLLGLLVLMTGCLGLFTKPRKQPAPPTIVQGTLSGPSGLANDASASISGEVPLANVPMAVYRLADFVKAPGSAPILQTGTTDGDGKFTLSGVPLGVDLIVVAATVPRLSVIVPASGRNMTADVNSATALVAETWA